MKDRAGVIEDYIRGFMRTYVEERRIKAQSEFFFALPKSR